MKKIVAVVATIGVFSTAHAQEAFKPPVAAHVQGAHCSAGMGPIPVMTYDANGHPMQCANTDKNGAGSWQYVAESDADRIARKLDQLNATDSQILAALTELVASERSHVQK